MAISYQIVRALCAAHEPGDIILSGRSLERAQSAAADVLAEFSYTPKRVWPLRLDITDDASIEAAFSQVQSQFGRLDALVNNAGTQLDQQQHPGGSLTSRQVWDQSWSVNTTSTHIVTATFVPLLLRSADARLLFMSSGTASLAAADNRALFVNAVPDAGWPKMDGAAVPAYRSAKTGMNMMMKEWHRTLINDGVKVWCVSPGYLATGLGGGVEFNRSHGAGDPALGGAFVRDVLEGKRDADVGKVVTADGVQPW